MVELRKKKEARAMSNQNDLVKKIDGFLRHKYGNASMSSQQRLFESYDKDLDGKINDVELTALLTDADVGNIFTRGAWVRGIMRHMDCDGDGLISWEEYRQAISRDS